ncbi:MAG: hypothetical protein WA160_16520 [Pseudobdellovibrio sp.]
MSHYLYIAIILVSSFSFAQDAPKTSNGGFTANDTAQVAGLLGGLVGGKGGAQAGNAIALISGISQMNTDLKNATNVVTDITGSAEKADAELAIVPKSLVALISAMTTAHLITVEDAISLKTEFLAFEATKKTCVSTAETSSLMCAEGTSPGAIKVRALMELATPALGLISSAQKACSSTAKITDFANKGLVLAKGMCVGAKALCDSACGSAASQLAALKVKVLPTAAHIAAEIAMQMADCGASSAGAAVCMPPLTAAKAALMEFKATVPPPLMAEQVPASLGTTASLVARCQSNMKDIVMFGLNVASLVAAKSSADECANKLAGGDQPKITTLEYCEMPANISAQFCVCKRNDKLEGCAGFVALKTDDPTKKADDMGNDVKTTGKGNQFASGNLNGKPSNALDNLTGSSNSDSSGKTTAADKAKGLAGGIGGYNAAGASDGIGSVPGSADSMGADGKGSDKKKWSFGSFMNSFGGGSDSGTSTASKKGALGQKDMDAIKRQIASEQIRSEVSAPSGKSNWEKVSERYLSNSQTLLSGK